MESVNSQSIIEEITIFINFNSIKIRNIGFVLRMRRNRNVKSEGEEISIILSEHGKALCQVENERNTEDSFEHGKGRSQAKNGRKIELSFRNAILIKASLFRKKYRRIFGYAFSEKSNLFREISRKEYGRFAPPSSKPILPNNGQKGRFCRFSIGGCTF